jgi:hypothetical protein
MITGDGTGNSKSQSEKQVSATTMLTNLRSAIRTASIYEDNQQS